jgi:hypothetical protein
MTVEIDLFDVAKALVSNRVYPDTAPFGTTMPYIVYQQVGGLPFAYLGREVPSKKNGRFQFTSWAATRKAAAKLQLDLEAALITATTMQASALSGPVALYEEDGQKYGAMQDFSVWSDR